MDNKKPAHVVAIDLIKKSLIALTNPKINDGIAELKNQHSIIVEALMILTELEMSDSTRSEVAYELKKIKIQEVVRSIEDAIKNFEKNNVIINYE